MNLLAADLSRHMGIAHGTDRPRLATYHLPTIGGDPSEGFDFGPTFAACWRTLADLIKVVKPDMIVFEAPLMPRGQGFATPEITVRLLMGLAALTETIAELHGIPCEERNVQSVKKFWTGAGRADKAAMMARCRQLGLEPKNDNEGDACALWYLVRAETDASFNPLFARAGA